MSVGVTAANTGYESAATVAEAESGNSASYVERPV